MIEWDELCGAQGWNSDKEITVDCFQILVDSTESSAYATDADLRACIAALRSGGTARATVWRLCPKTLEARSARPREELVNLLFLTLDEAENGVLLPEELRRCAELCGWEGDDDGWAIQYGELCTEFNIDAKKGAKKEQFAKILEKKAGKGNVQGRELVELIELVRLSEEPQETEKTWKPMSK